MSDKNSLALRDFKSKIDDGTLWNPRGVEYSQWLRDLVCALIDSGAVEDELLRLLGPFCRCKVTRVVLAQYIASEPISR